MYMNEVKRQKKLDTHIEGLRQNIKDMEEAIASFDNRAHSNIYTAPETPANEFTSSNGTVFGHGTYSKNGLVECIPYQNSRIAILEKIKKYTTISKEEHDFLIRTPIFNKDPLIKDYTNIEQVSLETGFRNN